MAATTSRYSAIGLTGMTLTLFMNSCVGDPPGSASGGSTAQHLSATAEESVDAGGSPLLAAHIAGLNGSASYNPDSGLPRPPDPVPLPTALRPSVGVYDVVDFVVPSSSWVAIPFRTKSYDALSSYDNLANRFTFSGETKVLICASLASFSTDFELDLFVNGYRYRAFAVSSHGIAQGCSSVSVIKGTIIEVKVYQASGAPLSFASNIFWDWLTLDRVADFGNLPSGSTFSSPQSAFTQVPYPAGDFLYGWEDPKNNRFYAVADADINVCAALASFAQNFELDAWINGRREKALALAQLGIGTGCRSLRLHAGDTMQLDVYQDSVANLSFSLNDRWNWLHVDSLPARSSAANINPFTAPPNTWTAVPYTEQAFNDRGEFDPSNGRFSVAETGDYHFCLSLWAVHQNYEVDLFVGGTRDKAIAVSRDGAAQGCRTVRVQAGYYVDARVFQSTSAPITFSPNSYWSWMTMAKIAP